MMWLFIGRKLGTKRYFKKPTAEHATTRTSTNILTNIRPGNNQDQIHLHYYCQSNSDLGPVFLVPRSRPRSEPGAKVDGSRGLGQSESGRPYQTESGPQKLGLDCEIWRFLSSKVKALKVNGPDSDRIFLC